MELLQLAVADLPAGLVSLPDDRRIAIRREASKRRAERSVPAPRVRADDAYALADEVQGRMPAESAAGVDVVVLAVARTRACRAQDDVVRPQLVTDAGQLG